MVIIETIHIMYHLHNLLLGYLQHRYILIILLRYRISIFKNFLLILSELLNSLLNPLNIGLLSREANHLHYGIFGISLGLYRKRSLLIVIVLCMTVFVRYLLHVYDTQLIKMYYP